jgi:DNA invertase Pin-like site-specific DNA recombinase
MRVVLYLRRSTKDLQPDSLDTQEEVLRKFATDGQHEVVRVFADSSSGRFVKGRLDFERLIESVKTGPDFDAVLVRDVSRWSRAENIDEAAFYEFICRSHGVEVMYAEENFGPEGSPYSLLMKSVKRAMAAEFCRDRARLIGHGQLRATREGYWVRGAAPYALKRVLIDESGAVICDMDRGERKSLSNHRVKIGPGQSEQVSVVRSIFHSYVVDQRSAEEIAVTLNADHVPSPRVKKWTPAGVTQILTTEAYKGTIVFHVRNGKKPSRMEEPGADSENLARCENALEAIIERDQWKEAQEILARRRTRTTDTCLAALLQEARELWHPSKMSMPEVTNARDLRDGYGRSDEEIIGAHLDSPIQNTLAALRQHFLVEPLQRGWLVEHILYLGIAVSLPHARAGGLHWRFEIDPADDFDAVIGLGFSPPSKIAHVETFIFARSSSPRNRTLRPLILRRKTKEPYLRPTTISDLAIHLRNAMPYRGPRAEAWLLGCLQGKRVVSLAKVSAGLGWPVTSVRCLYRRLERRGLDLPRIHGPGGSNVSILCPQCVTEWRICLRLAVHLESDLCPVCQYRNTGIDRRSHVEVACPMCRKSRLVRRAKVNGPDGKPSLCRHCSTRRNAANIKNSGRGPR